MKLYELSVAVLLMLLYASPAGAEGIDKRYNPETGGIYGWVKEAPLRPLPVDIYKHNIMYASPSHRDSVHGYGQLPKANPSPQLRAFAPLTPTDCYRAFRGGVETCGHRPGTGGTGWAGGGPCAEANAAQRQFAGGLIATILGTSTNNGAALLAGARALGDGIVNFFTESPACRECLLGQARSLETCLSRVGR